MEKLLEFSYVAPDNEIDGYGAKVPIVTLSTWRLTVDGDQ
jgi:hypothetical protein